jgi:hypothetical protein
LWNVELVGKHLDSCRLPLLKLWHRVILSGWLGLGGQAVNNVLRIWLELLLLPLPIVGKVWRVLECPFLNLWRILLCPW